MSFNRAVDGLAEQLRIDEKKVKVGGLIRKKLTLWKELPKGACECHMSVIHMRSSDVEGPERGLEG